MLTSRHFAFMLLSPLLMPLFAFRFSPIDAYAFHAAVVFIAFLLLSLPLLPYASAIAIAAGCCCFFFFFSPPDAIICHADIYAMPLLPPC